MKYKEADLLPLLGLDAIAFLRFLRMIRNLTIILAIMMSVVLIPVDLSYTLSSAATGDNKTKGLQILTMSTVSGARVWAHVAMSYLATIVCLYISELEMSVEVGLGKEWIRGDEEREH